MDIIESTESTNSDSIISDTNTIPANIGGHQGKKNASISQWMITFIHISFEAIIISGLAIYFYRKQNKQQEELDKLKQEMEGMKELLKQQSNEINQLKQVLTAHLNGIPQQPQIIPQHQPQVVPQQPQVIPQYQPQVVPQQPQPQVVPQQPQVVSPQPNSPSPQISSEPPQVLNVKIEPEIDPLEEELMAELLSAQKEVDELKSLQETPTPKKDIS